MANRSSQLSRSRRFRRESDPLKSFGINVQLYTQQFDFLAAHERFLAFVGGLGSGKTLTGCVRGALAAFGRVGDQQIKTPNLGVITAPTYPMLRDATLRTFFDVAGDLVEDYNKSDATALMTNGSEILFRSTTDPERLRGPNISWWYGDEAAMYEQRVWKLMLGRLREHRQAGYAWITTTPKGRNWVYQLFEQHRRSQYKKISVATWMNPFLDEEFIRSLMEEYQGDFALQELEGHFVGHEGLIYPEFSRDVHQAQTGIDARKYVYTVAGVDWGFSNPGVILVGGVDGDGRITIVHEEYQRQRRIEEWVRVAAQLRDLWKIKAFYCDPSEPDFIDAFGEAGLYAYKADNTVNPGIQAVKSRMVVRGDGLPRLLLVPDAVWTMTEFEQYQWAKNREGLRDVPMKAQDHTMDALRYLTMGVDAEENTAPVEINVQQWG